MYHKAIPTRTDLQPRRFLAYRKLILRKFFRQYIKNTLKIFGGIKWTDRKKKTKYKFYIVLTHEFF